MTTDGNSLPWGNARSIRQQLTQQDIEDFLNQPELFQELLQPILELEGALRAQAELDEIARPNGGYADGWGTMGNIEREE